MGRLGRFLQRGKVKTMNKAESLPASLEHYSLPTPPVGERLIASIEASLGILNVVPDKIGMSLLAGVYSAPILHPDYSIFLSGQTGAGKSELAALAQQHYGKEMNARNLPGSWASTANSIERLSFFAKDALIVVDDFCPAGSSFDIQRVHREADRILRSQGNRSGRSRLRSDLSMAQTFFPRGLILSTGEEIPKGSSLRARLWILEIGPHDVDFSKLSNAQNDASSGLLADSMAGESFEKSTS